MRQRWAIVLFASLLAVGRFPALGGDGQPANWPGSQSEGWSVTGPAAVRLISARDGFSPKAAATLGVQIKLRPGWWTYWRAPGDTGMPPEFNWSGSQNLKWTPEIFWPKPLQRTSFGHALRIYRDEVVFPIRVVAADPSKPIRLNLELTFGVCKDVCIPNKASVKFDLQPSGEAIPLPIPAHMTLIRRFEAAVPSANAQRSGVRIQNVGIVKTANGSRVLTVELRRAAPDAQPLVIVEVAPGEAPLIAKSLGRQTPYDVWRFAAELEEGQQDGAALAGRRVRVTILDGGRSLEQIWVVGATADRSGRFGPAATGRQMSDPMSPDQETWKPRD